MRLTNDAEQRLAATQIEGKSRKVTGFSVEKAKLHCPDGLYVAKTIEDGEGFTILEDTCAVVSKRGIALM